MDEEKQNSGEKQKQLATNQKGVLKGIDEL